MVNIKYIFSGLPRSEFVEENIRSKLDNHLARFKRDGSIHGSVRLDMENSPSHPGPDSFGCKIHLASKFFKEIVIHKSAQNIYTAIAEAVEKLDSVLSKLHSQKVKERRHRRRTTDPVELQAEERRSRLITF